MNKQKNTKSLLEISRSVSNLVSDPVKMKRFREQCKDFYDEVVKQECKKDEEQTSDPLDRLVLPYATISDANIGLLIDDDKPKHLSIPFDKEKSLRADYVLLTIIHDKKLKNPRTPLISDGIWPKDEEWVELKWREISSGYVCGSVDVQSHIELALERVRADLASGEKTSKADLPDGKPAEKRQDTTPAKEKNQAPVINIQNFKGVLGDVQAENVQTGDHASIQNATKTQIHKGKVNVGSLLKKITGWIFKKTSHLIITITVGVVVAVLVDILGDFGWLEPIKEFIKKILWSK